MMPDRPRTCPAILRTAWRAWTSTGAAMRAMPLAFLLTAAASALVATVIGHLASPTVVLPPPRPAPPVPGAVPLLLSGLASSFAYALAAAPLAVAVHRFVVLGERPPLLPLRLLSRMLRYAAWVTLLGVSASLPFLFLERAPPVLTLLASIVLTVATVRLTLLLPQIATLRPGQPLRTFWADTRWRFWNTATVLALSVMPVLPLPFLVVLATRGRLTQATLAESLDSPLESALNALYVALAAAAASWLFIEYSRGDGAPDTVEPSETPRPDPHGLEVAP